MAKVESLEGKFPKPKLDSLVSWESNGYFGTRAAARINPDDLVARKGLPIYAQMRVDEQVKAVMQFKRDAINARGYTFKFSEGSSLSPDEQKARIGVYCRIIERTCGSFEDALNGIATGRDFGFSLTEKVFGTVTVDGKAYIGINRLVLRDPNSFEFVTDDYGLLTECRQIAGGKKQPIDLHKFVHYVHAPEFDQYYGRSDLREAYRSWYAKDQLIRLWSMYLERFAGGFGIAKRGPESNLQYGTAEYTSLQNAMANLKGTSSMILPKGIELEVVMPAATDQYERAIVFHDLAIAKSLLVPNLLGISHTGQTGAYSQSQTQLEAFFWTINADTKRLEACLNEQLFTDLGDQNWGDGEYPSFAFKPASLEHMKWVIDTFQKLAAGGQVQVTEADEAYIRQLLELPERDPDDAVLVNPVEQAKLDLQQQAQDTSNKATDAQIAAQDAAAKQSVKATRELLESLGERLDKLTAEFTWNEEDHPRIGAGDERGGEFAPNGGGPVFKDGADLAAVDWYAANGYMYTNDILRKGKLAEASDATKNGIARLDSIIQRSQLREPTTLYRVVAGKRAGDKYLKEGAIVTDAAFLSTSTSENSALSAVKDASGDVRAGVTLEIRAPSGMPALDVDSRNQPNGVQGQRASEREYLLLRNLPLRVVSVDVENRRAVVEPVIRHMRVSVGDDGDNGHQTSHDATPQRRIVAHTPDGSPRSATREAFTRAVSRVNFSVIEKRTDDELALVVPVVSTLVARAVKRSLGSAEDMAKLLDADTADVQTLELDRAAVGRIKQEFIKSLTRTFNNGSAMAFNEVERARQVLDKQLAMRRQDFAALRQKAAGFIEANGFRMAGNVSDGTRAIIQQELLSGIKYGKSPVETRVDIWDRLTTKGFLTREAVRQVESEALVVAALDELWAADETAAAAYLDTLVRTNTFEALNEARYSEFTDPALADFVMALEYASVLDSSTTEICQQLDGVVFKADSELWDTYRPPNHYNCRSLLIAVSVIDGWDGQESPAPTVEPQEGFK